LLTLPPIGLSWRTSSTPCARADRRVSARPTVGQPCRSCWACTSRRERAGRWSCTSRA